MSTSRSLAAVGLPLLVSLLLTEVKCACDPTTGPAGSIGCVKSNLYNNQLQYATCHTTSYILQKSQGAHFCLNGAYYCYYQCMLNVYDKENGSVSSDCQCTSNSIPSSTLPSDCYSPSGTNCGWYLTCLERKLGCSGGLDSYVMAFSQKLCTLAEGNADVTPAGLRWLNATRICLQVELAPLLLPYESFTCSDVSAHAYEKQAGCYSKPYQSEPGICSVSYSDFWKIFWRTRDILGLSFVESLLGLLRTKLSCTGDLPFESTMYLMNIRLRLPLSRRKRDVPSVSRASISQMSLEKTPFVMATRVKRHSRHVSYATSSRARRAATSGVWQGETIQQRLYHDLANKGALSISRLLGWDVQEVLWFAYGTKTADSNVFNVSLLFVDRQSYGLQKNAWSPRVNTKEAVIAAGQVLSRSDTSIMINNQRAWMQKFQACADINCQLVFYTSEQTDSGMSSTQGPTKYLLTSKQTGSWMSSTQGPTKNLFTNGSERFCYWVQLSLLIVTFLVLV